jgi:hypothetical protein
VERPAVNGPVNMLFFCYVGTGILGTVYALISHVGTAANEGKFNNECPVSLFSGDKYNCFIML